LNKQCFAPKNIKCEGPDYCSPANTRYTAILHPTYATKNQRTSSAYIFGAICPAEGKGAGLVLPSCNSEAMALHLEEISLAVAPGAHAILLLDQAGWHVSKRLSIPDNITLLPLPPKSPELNPIENIWQFMRDNWLSNRVFKSYDDILDHCCFAWNKLIDMPWKIQRLGLLVIIIKTWHYNVSMAATISRLRT
jgi:transposase